jgi:hypothetical protein
MASTLTTASGSLFASKNGFLVVACKDELIRMRLDDRYLSFSIDFDFSDIEYRTQAFFDEQVNNSLKFDSLLQSNTIENLQYPPRFPTKLGMDMLLLTGSRVEAAARVSVESLLDGDLANALRKQDWKAIECYRNKTVTKTITFDKQIGS